MSAALLRSGQWWRQLIRYAISEGVPRRSLIVAAVVGTVLNLINQGDRLLGGERPQLLKLALTYLVPYIVSTYGAVSFRFAVARAETRRPRCAGEQDASSRDPL